MVDWLHRHDLIAPHLVIAVVNPHLNHVFGDFEFAFLTERREALSIPGAERSLRARKRARRGFGVCAAQSCTSGIDRRSRPERQTSP